MAFRGIFDGSVEIGQAREARAHATALQQQRIAAEMAMQTQQLRAKMAMQTQQLQAGMQQANADRALKQQQFAVGADQAQQQIDIKRQEFDSGAALREMQQTNAKLMLQQAQAEFDEDQARRATLTQFRQSAFGAGLITAALNGVAPTTTLSRINRANGVADGDPGSIVGMGGGPDGLWYDVIAADEQGKIGKKHQEVDPMAVLAVAHSLYGEKGVGEFIQMYKTKDTNNTRMNIAFDKYLQSLEFQKLKNDGAKEVAGIKRDTTLAVEDKKTDRAIRIQELKNQVGGVLGISAAKVNLPSAVKTLTEQLDNLDAEMRGAEKRKQPLDPEKVKRREDVQKALDNVLGMLGDDGAETAGARFVPAPNAGAAFGAPANAGAGADRSSKASVTVDKDKLVVTIDGQTARVPDIPENRATLQQRYGIRFEAQTQPATVAPAKDAAPAASTAPAPQGTRADIERIAITEQKPAAKLPDEQVRSRQNAVASTEKAGSSTPASQPATKNAGKQKSWTTPSSTPLFEAGADGKRGKANVEPGKNTQRLGSNKAPAAAELRFTKQQEESLTDEDRRAIAKIHADSLNLEEDPVTGLVPDRETYRKQKVMEYFQQKFETEFKRLFGEAPK